MHPYVAAGALCAALLVAGAALSAAGVQPDAPSEDDHHVRQGRPAGSGHGVGAHPWAGGAGAIPSSTAALDHRDSITIGADSDFNPANGVRGGRGTLDDPFLISGWSVGTLYVHDTSKAFEIKENRIGRLVLDWTGAGGYVHHNHVANLRTNRNVERTGDPSATVIEKNQIDKVEELRHFDGILRNNTIGRPPLLGLVDLRDDVVLNIAGLNGAGIHDNLILGGVDMKLHGHHHGDAEGAHSHSHGQPDRLQGDDHVEDHQVRYIDFLFYGNTIRDNGFGLRYNDLNHAGDDRTATSEDEPDLEKPHVHHTRVSLVDNVIEGATLRIAVLNADDERHLPGQSAELLIANNRVLRPMAGDGLVVQDVRDARVHVIGNKVEKGELQLSGTSGILLQRVRNATLHLEGNMLGDYKYGIRARDFDANTTWTLGRNSAPGAEHAVYWDNSVPNAPERAEGDHAHGHGGAAAAPAALVRLGRG